jgi:ribonuclease J
MLVQHALLAEGAGVDVDKIFVLENGHVVSFDGERATMAATVAAGAVLVDGIAAIDGIDGVVLRDRRMLASDGVVMVALTIDAKTGQPVGMPDLVSRGFLSDPEDPLIASARDHLLSALQQRREDEHAAEAGYVKTKIRDTLSRYFHQHTKRRPMILPIVMEV